MTSSVTTVWELSNSAGCQMSVLGNIYHAPKPQTPPAFATSRASSPPYELRALSHPSPKCGTAKHPTILPSSCQTTYEAHTRKVRHSCHQFLGALAERVPHSATTSSQAALFLPGSASWKPAFSTFRSRARPSAFPKCPHEKFRTLWACSTSVVVQGRRTGQETLGICTARRAEGEC